jgi:hypothetical protein
MHNEIKQRIRHFEKNIELSQNVLFVIGHALSAIYRIQYENSIKLQFMVKNPRKLNFHLYSN